MGLFSTVPKTDFLKFLYMEDGSVDARLLSEFLNLTRADLAAMFGVNADSIRFDGRLSFEMKEKMIELANLCEMVAQNFQGNVLKTKTWFIISNPHLNNRKPLDLIKTGNNEELVATILSSSNIEPPAQI